MKKLTTISKSLSLHLYTLRLNPFSLIFVLFSLFTFSASAQTIKYVTPGGGSGIKDGSTWAKAAPGSQLQTIITEATSGTQIWVAAGTYTPTINPVTGMAGVNRDNTFLLKDGVALYGGFKGTGNGGRPETIAGRNITANPTILSGDLDNDGDISDNAYHVVLAIGCSSSTILDGFIIEKGNANDDNNGVVISGISISTASGGGIYNSSSSFVISNTMFRNNIAVDRGGALANDGQSFPSIINSVFSSNSSNSSGSAIYSYKSSPIIINSTFTNNISMNLKDGTICNDADGMSSPVIITNSILYGNTGVGISNPGTATAIVSNSIVQGGYADGGANIIDADPLFINPSAGDFRLQAGSPAINKGDKTKIPAEYLTTDLAGKPRVTGSNVDMGAYETSVVYGMTNAYEQVTNILSPNGDGINDVWKIDDLNIYPNNEVKIFSSNGVLLRSYKNYQNDWDGTLNGQRLKEDTYYYVISVPSGKEVTKGFITILY
ncbi:MAG: gliding motility-associated C-terminal domain-containing protein [Daejeonella sp.]